jgi:hypothetical protein
VKGRSVLCEGAIIFDYSARKVLVQTPKRFFPEGVNMNEYFSDLFSNP